MTSKFPPSTAMIPKQQQSTQLTQGLMMTAHMQQAIQVMQLPVMELSAFIEEQVADNPLLEILDENNIISQSLNESDPDHLKESEEKEFDPDIVDLSLLSQIEDESQENQSFGEESRTLTNDDEKLQNFKETLISSPPTLFEQLLTKYREIADSAQDCGVAEILIGYLDEKGFLTTPLEEIALLHDLNIAELIRIKGQIQDLEPFGIAAESIQECLLIQLTCLHKMDTLSYRIIKNHYDDLLHNRIPVIQKEMKISYHEIEAAVHEIAKLDLHPGLNFSKKVTQTIIPDINLREDNGQLIVEVDRDYAPSLGLNRRYLKLLKDESILPEIRQFIKHHLVSAKWLVRNLQNRYSTLERIGHILVRAQHNFFMNIEGQLTPMTMQMVADELELHESTIARTVSGKYLNSPRGVFPLRTFFTNKYISNEGHQLSSKTIKETIHGIIAQEDKKKPLSDAEISTLLNKKGIKCARRTVTKFRMLLEIGNTQQRRKFH